MATSSELRAELAKLEAQLLELRHDPDPPPPPSGPKGRRARLRNELAALEAKIAKRHRVLGVAESPKGSSLSQLQWVGLGLVVASAAVFGAHLLVSSRVHMVWRATICTTSWEGDTLVAHYTAQGRSYSFSTGELPSGGPGVRCWVPDPPERDGVGRFTAPKTSTVPYKKQLGFWWIAGPGVATAVGLLMLLFLDRKKD